MPKSDGSIVFSTTLDNSELEKGLRGTVQEIKELEKELAEYGAEWCYARGKQEELEICRQTYEKIYAAIKAEN